MNTLDKQYTDLLQDILHNGVKKQTRNGEVISVFGRTIRHKMSEGFPLITTKKMYWKGIVTELLWFLRGETNIKFLVDNDCHIWDGDAYKAYQSISLEKEMKKSVCELTVQSMTGKKFILTKEEFINKIKTDDEFAKKWGELGPIYGKQWRKWTGNGSPLTNDYEGNISSYLVKHTDQIANLIKDLKTNPDSRRLMVSAWNVGELDQMVLPPCHYGFQVYTRLLSLEERAKWLQDNKGYDLLVGNLEHDHIREVVEDEAPTRAISLIWNQRSVDTPLGLPFNLASYGLLLEIIAKMVNMVPEELIGNLGDTHIYSNQIEGVKEQIGRERTHEERVAIYYSLENKKDREDEWTWDTRFEDNNITKRTREPYTLPQLRINTEFWPTKSGECGVGELIDNVDSLIKQMKIEDFQIENYQSHPAIKMPLSN